MFFRLTCGGEGFAEQVAAAKSLHYRDGDTKFLNLSRAQGEVPETLYDQELRIVFNFTKDNDEATIPFEEVDALCSDCAPAGSVR